MLQQNSKADPEIGYRTGSFKNIWSTYVCRYEKILAKQVTTFETSKKNLQAVFTYKTVDPDFFLAVLWVEWVCVKCIVGKVGTK